MLFGLVLYEMLIGELPGRRSPMPSDVIQGLPQPIDDLFDSMTQDSIKKRPQNMQEVLNILNQVPPFDRLFSQSMVMTFTNPPFELPGLKHLKIPEFEENLDFQKTTKDRQNEIDEIRQGRQTKTVMRSEEEPYVEEVQQVNSINESSAVKSSSTQDENQIQNKVKNPVEAQSEVQTEAQGETSAKTASSVKLQAQTQEIESNSSPAPTMIELADSNLQTESSSAPSPLMASFNQAKESQSIELEEIEELEELEEVIDSPEINHQSHSESPVFSSTSSAAHQAYVRSSSAHTNTKQPEVNAIAQEASKRLDNAMADDFSENEKTALHHRPTVEEKPHLTQPHRPRRSSHSITQQLFEKQRKRQSI